jgi:hypothetical protein
LNLRIVLGAIIIKHLCGIDDRETVADNKGWRKKGNIIYHNGKAVVTSLFFFIRSYRKVKPGSQIIVPEKREVKKMLAGE